MATILSRESLFVSWSTYYVTVMCFICLVYADESMLSPDVSGEYYRLATGQRVLDNSETVQHVRLKYEEGSLFFRILLTTSKLTKSYQDVIPQYEGRSLKCLVLPNATLMICFSVVLGYMVYIVTALMLKPVPTEDHTNPAVKVLLSDKVFSDSVIPPKLRGLYGEMESGSSETFLGFKKTEISAANECCNDTDEKSVADQLFSSAT